MPRRSRVWPLEVPSAGAYGFSSLISCIVAPIVAGPPSLPWETWQNQRSQSQTRASHACAHRPASALSTDAFPMFVARSSLRRQALPRLLSVRCWKSGNELAGLGRRRATTSSDETAGLGVSVDVEGVGRTSLVKAMMNAIDMPERFLPVTSVSVRAAIGHAASEGALWRRLVLDGTPTTEHIYANPAAGEIRFVPVDGEQEGALEVVNELHRSPLRIEHYQRDRTTLQRVHWSAPRPRIVAAIEATVQLAKAAEAEAADTSFHKKEFPS